MQLRILSILSELETVENSSFLNEMRVLWSASGDATIPVSKKITGTNKEIIAKANKFEDLAGLVNNRIFASAGDNPAYYFACRGENINAYMVFCPTNYKGQFEEID